MGICSVKIPDRFINICGGCQEIWKEALVVSGEVQDVGYVGPPPTDQ